jgi:hypothetical protein
LADINRLAVLLSAVTCSVLGALWFTLLFRAPYAAAPGKDPSSKPDTSTIFSLGPLLCILVTSRATAGLMQSLGIEKLRDAALFGAIVGVRYLVATTFCVAINANRPRPFLYGLVSGGYVLAGSWLSSIILVVLSSRFR